MVCICDDASLGWKNGDGDKVWCDYVMTPVCDGRMVMEVNDGVIL